MIKYAIYILILFSGIVFQSCGKSEKIDKAGPVTTLKSISKFYSDNSLIYTISMLSINDTLNKVIGTYAGFINLDNDKISTYSHEDTSLSKIKYGIKRNNNHILRVTINWEYAGLPGYFTQSYNYTNKKLKDSYLYAGNIEAYGIDPCCGYKCTYNLKYVADNLTEFTVQIGDSPDRKIFKIQVNYYSEIESENILNTNYFNNIALDSFIINLQPLHPSLSFPNSKLLLLDGSFSYLGSKSDYLVKTYTISDESGSEVESAMFTYERNSIGQIVRLNQLDGDGGDTIKYYYLFEYEE